MVINRSQYDTDERNLKKKIKYVKKIPSAIVLVTNATLS